jgi:UPF0755 protein
VLRSLRFLVRLIAILMIIAGTTVIVAAWWSAQPLRLPVSPYAFDVKSGATLKSVARELAGANVLPNEYALVLLARLRRADRAIKAGNYEIAEGISLSRLLDKLTQGDVTQSAMTVVEGSTYAELIAALKANPDIAKPTVELPAAEMPTRIGTPNANPEGWFFPDTYFFAKGSKDTGLLARGYGLMRSRLDDAWARRAEDLPLKDPYEALILASIVEKETGNPVDRPLVASVFVNRLRLGMRLQSDPTVIYGLGVNFDGNLRKRDLETDSPYNTYTRDGLPPTPIALPGQASLDAVTRPPKTAYLYFVARGDGTSEFTTNLADHNRAVAKFQLGQRPSR